MDKDFESTITEFKINLVEYCTLMEDLTIPDDTTAFIKVHKIMPFCSESEPTVTDSLFINDDDCKPQVSGSIKLTDKIEVPVLNVIGIAAIGTSITIPKGSKMIALFMDNNINDPYLTTWDVK